MVYLLAAVFVLTIVRYARAIRRERSWRPLRELAAAGAAGLLAGLWIGVVARGAMRLITIMNGAVERWSVGGSLEVVAVFTGIGGVLGLSYAGLFRPALQRRGAVFGILLIVASAYPLFRAVRQVLSEPPPLPTLLLFAGALLAAVWLPYALALERILARLLTASTRTQ